MEHAGTDTLGPAVAQWDAAGFAVLPGYLTPAELAPALRALPRVAPAPGGGDDGVVPFPFAAVELSLLAVHPGLVALAAALLRTDDLRLVRAEVRVATAGAAPGGADGGPPPSGYERHTPLVPSDDPRFRQVEVVVHLSDVTSAHGPALFLDGAANGAAAEVVDGPLGPGPVGAPTPATVAPTAATGPAGTVVVHEIGTAPAATPITAPDGARYTLHVGLRPATAEWGIGQGWAGVSQQPAWSAFVHRAHHRQLALVGFPPPGHPYWTHRTLRAMAERYPRLDLTRWAHRVSETRPA